MKKTLLILAILILSSLNIFGQVDNMKKEILSYQENKSILISNGRKMIIDKINIEDKQKIAELLDYLNKQEDKKYMVFYPMEKWLMYYWTQQYQPLLKDILAFNIEYTDRMSKQTKPQSDSLRSKLKEKISEHRHEIKNQISLSELSNEEKSLLSLNLDYLISDENNEYITQDDLNFMSNDFLKSYPSSNYYSYVKTYIRYEYVPSKWGFGTDFSLGCGIFTGKLAKNFNDNFAIAWGLDFGYEDFTLYLRLFEGFSSTKENLNFNGTIWQKGAQADVGLAEASIGYAAYENKKIKVSPFMGISSINFSASKNDIRTHPEYDNVGFSSTTYTLGLNLDFKFKSPSYPSYGFIRVRYSYNMPQLYGYYNPYTGNFHCLTVGLGAFGRDVKRVE